MLDLKKIRLEPEAVRTALKKRNISFDIDLLLKLEEQKRNLLQKSDEMKKDRNDLWKEIGKSRKNPKNEETLMQLTEKVRQLTCSIEDIDREASALNEKIHELLLVLPNLPAPNVPVGEAADKNQVIHTYGAPRVFAWEPKTFLELRNDLQLCAGIPSDTSEGCVYQSSGAAFKRALTNFLFDSLAEAGYRELSCVKNRELLERYRDTIVEASFLPLLTIAEERNADHDHCLVLNGFAAPEASCHTLEIMAATISSLFEKLELPCRIINLCSGELDFEAAKMLNVEIWLPSSHQFVEAVRFSNCTDYLSRDFSIRYRRSAKEKPEYIHTLCGKIDVDLLIAALWENTQIDDGNIEVPACLRKYFGENIICKQR